MFPFMMPVPPGARQATDDLIKRQMSGPKMAPPMAPPMPPMPTPPQILQRGPQGVAASQPAQPAQPGMLGGFFDTLDRNMQSPSKQLGIGLLGELHPALALGGLLAGGIFGGRNAP